MTFPYYRVAIVGSSVLDDKQLAAACLLIEMIVHWESTYKDIIVVSGGADGVDTLADTTAYNRGIPRDIRRPEQQNWKYFKKRNIEIAENCDVLYRIASTKSKTYGSGWTADYAESLGIEVIRIYV